VWEGGSGFTRNIEWKNQMVIRQTCSCYAIVKLLYESNKSIPNVVIQSEGMKIREVEEEEQITSLVYNRLALLLLRSFSFLSN
jgi:hypothetical protein